MRKRILTAKRGYAVFRFFRAAALASGLFVFGQVYGRADTAKVPVVAGHELHRSPFSFAGKDGEIQGFSVELLRAALEAEGRSVTFTSGTTTELRNLLERGEIQVLPRMARTPARESVFDFSFPYLRFEGALVVRDDRRDLRVLEDLRGRRIAVLEGDDTAELLAQSGIDAEVSVAESLDHALEQVSQGEFDAAIVQRLSALRAIRRARIKNLTVLDYPLNELERSFSFAVKEGDSALLALLNDGLAMVIADGTFHELRMKWLAGLETPVHNHIVVGGDNDFPPYEFLDADGNPAGFNVELTRSIAAEMGFDVEIRLGPWNEILDALDNGEIDAIQGLFYSPERSEKFAFSQPHNVVDYVCVIRNNSGHAPKKLADLRDMRIVVMDNDIMHDLIRTNDLEAQTTVVDTQETAMIEVAEGRSDCALVARLPALYWIDEHGWNNLRVAGESPKSLEYCYAVRPDHKALVARISEGLKALEQTGEYYRVREKWLGAYDEPDFSARTVWTIAGTIALPLVFALVLVITWSWTLRRTVARRTAELHHSQATLRAALDHSPTGIAIARAPDGELEYVNEAGLQIRGVAETSVVDGVSARDYVDTWQIFDLDGTPLGPDEVPLARAVQLGEECSRKFIVRRGEDDDRIVWANAAPIRDGSGKVVSGIVVFTDITELQRAEDRLRQSEQRLLEAQHVGSVGDWRFNPRSGEIVGSQEMFRLYQRDPSLGQPSLDEALSYYVREDAARFRASIQKAMDAGTETDDIYRLNLPDGRTAIHQGRIRVERNDSGEVVALFGTVHDVTELVEKRSRYQQILQATADGYWLMDMDRRILEANPASAAMLGYSIEELTSLSVRDIDANESADFVHKQTCVLDQQSTDQFETRHRRKDGSVIDVEVSCSYSPQGGGRIVAFIRDITLRKEQESVREFIVHLLSLLSRENGLDELMRDVTKLMRDWSGCQAVGIRLNDGEDFPYFETSGFPATFVHMENCLCARDETGAIVRDSDGNPTLECMCGNVICRRVDPKQPFFTEFGSFWTNSTSELLASTTDADRQARTRNRCHGQGYESVALIPLRHGEENLGLLQFNDPRKGRFTKHRIALFERLGANLAIGLVQRRTAEALRESEARYRSMFLTNTATKLIIDPESGFIVDANPAACAFYGYSLEQLTTLRIWDINSLGEEETRRKMAMARTGDQAIFEFQHRLASGEMRDVQVHSGTIKVGERQLLHSIILDITKLKQAEEARRTSDARYRLLFERSAYAIYVHDLDGRLTDVNKQASFQTDYTREELLTMTVFDLLSDKSRQEEIRAAWRQWPDAQTAVFEDRHHRKSGEAFPVEITVNKVLADGEPIFVAMVSDLTERKTAEQERGELQGQLLQSQKLESVGRLAGGVAHDFNNMLNVILGNAEMLLEGLDTTDPMYTEVQDIFQAGKRSSDLTRQLLAFARQQTIEPRILDLNEAIASMIKMVGRLIGEDIEVIWTPGKNLWPVSMDPTQVDQVLANLVVNARYAIDGVGTVRIETENVEIAGSFMESNLGAQPGDYVRFEVTDTGVGMDAESLARIFEPFYTTKPAGQGTGLGLSTVYGIVKQNGGFLDVSSQPGQGTSFQIYIPRAHVCDESPDAPERERAIHTGSETVLLVEDEAIVLKLAQRILSRVGYNVLSTNNPQEALELARTYDGAIDVLLTDVVMPGMSGRDLWERFEVLRPGTKCLFMSGYTADIIARHGILDEGLQFVNKPFTPDSLAAKLREVLDA